MTNSDIERMGSGGSEELWFLAGLVFCCDYGVDLVAHVEISHHCHSPGTTGRSQVVQNAIDDVLMERPFLTEGPEIEL